MMEKVRMEEGIRVGKRTEGETKSTNMNKKN